MTSRRPPSDGGSARSTALPGSCSEIGRQLAGVRAAKRLTVEEVASRLLLSRAQVIGLESADAAAFYTSAYFLRGLRKYMTLAGVPEELLDLAPHDEAEPEDPDALRLTFAEPEDLVSLPHHTRLSWRPWAGGLAALVVTLSTAGLVPERPAVPGDELRSDTLQLAALTPLPAEPLRVSTALASLEEASPATAPPLSYPSLQVSVGKDTWVFVRLPDDQVTQRRLSAGEQFAVERLPVYLAIGTADSVDVRVQSRRIALDPYIRNGQVRITRPELAALGSAARPR